MKYLVAILLGALLVGGALTVAVHYFLGSSPSYFFAKFIAGPVGLMISGFGFLVYDSLWPKQKNHRGD